MLQVAHFVLLGPNEEYDGDLLPIRMVPSTKVNNGWDTSTQAILAEITSELVSGKRVLDFGTGSGILAIAAVQAGAIEVVACENAPEAKESAIENFNANGVNIRLEDSLDAEEFDVMIANVSNQIVLDEALRQAKPKTVLASLGPFDDPGVPYDVLAVVNNDCTIALWRL